MSIASKVYSRETLLKRQSERRHDAIEYEVIEVVSAVLENADHGKTTVSRLIPDGKGAFTVHESKSFYDVSKQDILNRLRTIFPDCKIAVEAFKDNPNDPPGLYALAKITIDWT